MNIPQDLRAVWKQQVSFEKALTATTVDVFQAKKIIYQRLEDSALKHESHVSRLVAFVYQMKR